jgi:hypothetical protein
MARKVSTQAQQLPPKIVLGLMPELTVYQISEAELNQLANGPPSQTDFSFALAMLPAALTIFVTLQTVDILSNRTYYTYVIAFGLLTIQGLISLARWWFSDRSFKVLVHEIRARVPEKPGIPDQIKDPIEASEAPPSG